MMNSNFESSLPTNGQEKNDTETCIIAKKDNVSNAFEILQYL